MHINFYQKNDEWEVWVEHFSESYSHKREKIAKFKSKDVADQYVAQYEIWAKSNTKYLIKFSNGQRHWCVIRSTPIYKNEVIFKSILKKETEQFLKSL